MCVPIKVKMCPGLLLDSHRCLWCWRSIAALVETCSISSEEAGVLWGPQQGADSVMLSSVKTEKAITASVSDNNHKQAHQHSGGELLDPRQRFVSQGSVIIKTTAGVKEIRDQSKPLKIRLHERCSRNVQHSARVQWGSHFLKYFTTSNQWHHSGAGWAATLPHKEQQTASALQLDWDPELQSQRILTHNIQPKNTREHAGKLHTSATD